MVRFLTTSFAFSLTLFGLSCVMLTVIFLLKSL